MIADMVWEAARTSNSIDSHDMRKVHKLTAVHLDFLQQKLGLFLRDCAHAPALLSFSSDGTPIKTHMKVAKQLGDSNIKREGKRCDDYLVQVAFFRFLDASGQPKGILLFAPPSPETQGKAAIHQFAAGCSFMKTLRQRGHQGIVVQHYAFDRANYTALGRLFKQHHLSLQSGFGGDARAATYLSLQEWVVTTGCAAHDCHNAFKWSMNFHTKNDGLLKDIFIGFASLRNAYNLIVEHLPGWVLRHICWTPDSELPSVEDGVH